MDIVLEQFNILNENEAEITQKKPHTNTQLNRKLLHVMIPSTDISSGGE